MKRLYIVLIVGILSASTLAGCSKTEQSATEKQPTATSTESSASNTPENPGKGVSGLLSVVSNTKTAVEAGDFAKAKQEFDKFEDVWKTIEDGIKTKSPASYKAIEDSLDKVTGELKGTAPNKEKVMTELKSLDKSIQGVKQA